MNDDRLLRLYNLATGQEKIGFYSIYERNLAHLAIYRYTTFTWEMNFLRDVYEELQKELPTIKKKVIAKAIRELKEEYKLFESIKHDMKWYDLDLLTGADASLKCVNIYRSMKKEFKNYVKEAFIQNRVKWHWWNNLEWGL